ncbi:hypothetical protein K439DRAFT_1620575 [Ramaria rubella]|nr:hypothetical protein K439DRAFT_1620575 [Ramaria rubella]
MASRIGMSQLITKFNNNTDDQIHTGSGSGAGSASDGLNDDSNIQDVSPAPSNHFDEEVSLAPSNHFEEEDDISDTTGSGPPLPVIEELKTAMLFIQGLEQANLDNGDLSEDVLERLRHPPEEELSIEDPNDLYALALVCYFEVQGG